MTTILYLWGQVRWRYVLPTMALSHWPLIRLFSCALWRILCSQDHHKVSVCLYYQLSIGIPTCMCYLSTCKWNYSDEGGSMLIGTNVLIHMDIHALPVGFHCCLLYTHTCLTYTYTRTTPMGRHGTRCKCCHVCFYLPNILFAFIVTSTHTCACIQHQ